jgi:hypothetical protein
MGSAVHLSITLPTLIVLAGLGQLALALGSLAIPRILGWREDTAKLKPLTRQVFWTYAGYIWATNVSFGVLSVAAPRALLAGGLAAAVAGFITAYWLARVVIQFTYFDRSSAPPGAMVKLGEIALVALFVGLVLVYGCATLVALGWLS